MSNNIEEVGFTGRKLIFPIMITVVGLALLIMGLQVDPVANASQSSWFIFGSLAVLSAGIITILYVLDIINRIVHVSLMFVLLVVCVIMAILSYISLMRTIELNEKYDVYKTMNTQALMDIKVVQEEYKIKYNRYAKNLDSLEYFLLNETVAKTNSVFLRKDSVPAITSIPDRQPNEAEIAILGYDRFDKDDYKKILDGIDEQEAIILKYLRIDTTYTPVYDHIFEKQKKKKVEREYPFDSSKFLDVHVDEDDTRGPRKFDYRYSIVEVDSATVLTKFEVLDPTPYHPIKGDLQPRDTLKIGSMIKGGTAGSWEL